jgi:hypothetical protein
VNEERDETCILARTFITHYSCILTDTNAYRQVEFDAEPCGAKPPCCSCSVLYCCTVVLFNVYIVLFFLSSNVVDTCATLLLPLKQRMGVVAVLFFSLSHHRLETVTRKTGWRPRRETLPTFQHVTVHHSVGQLGQHLSSQFSGYIVFSNLIPKHKNTFRTNPGTALLISFVLFFIEWIWHDS